MTSTHKVQADTQSDRLPMYKQKTYDGRTPAYTDKLTISLGKGVYA